MRPSDRKPKRQARDKDRWSGLYTEIIGWSTEVMDVGKGAYTVFKIGDRPVAGLTGESHGA